MRARITPNELFENYTRIFQREVEIVRPTHLIFFTNTYFDDILSSLKFKFVDKSYEIENKSIDIGDKREIPFLHSVYTYKSKLIMRLLRTRHPQGTSLKFDNKIAEWITNNHLILN